jgi:hypothetical protein
MMGNLAVSVTSEEYKTRFLKHLKDVYEIDGDMANSELEASLESWGEGEEGSPEDDADECLSYWGS